MAETPALAPLTFPPLRLPAFPLPLPTLPAVSAPTPPAGSPLPLQMLLQSAPQPSDFLNPLRDATQAFLNSTVGLAMRSLESFLRSLPSPPTPPAPPAAR